MSKADLGKKRTCQGCGARYYDLNKDPAVCPSCGTVFELERATRNKRSAPGKSERAEATVDDEELDVAVDDDADLAVVDDDEDDSVMEDASDLGEDDDDMSEIVEHIDSDVVVDKD